MPEESASKEFVRDAIKAEHDLTDEKFKSRDKAIELLASKAPIFIALASMLLAALAIAMPFMRH